MSSSSHPGSVTDRRSDIPLQVLLGSITFPMFGGIVYVLATDLAVSTKVTIALCVAAIALPMAGLMGYIMANPPMRTTGPRGAGDVRGEAVRGLTIGAGDENRTRVISLED